MGIVGLSAIFSATRGFRVFQGAAQLSLDAKGRLAVPTRHRERLQLAGRSELVLTAHPHRCVLLFPVETWEPIRDRITTFSSFDPQTSLWKRLLVGFAEEVTPDSTGRVLLSPELRKFAGIDRQVMMVGQGSHFEIWSVEAWDAQLSRLEAQSDKVPPGMENFAL